MRLRGPWQVALGALVLAPALARASAPSLSHAEALYEIRDAEGAEHELRALLSHKLPTRVAATAHLYLGMVALEAHSDPDAARAEFARALKLDPNSAMPLSATPEELQLFERSRDQLPYGRSPNELASPLPTESAPEPVPAGALAKAKAPAGHGPWPWVLGGAAIAAAAVSVWGFVQVAADNSAAAQSRSQPVTLAQAQSSVSQGQLGQDVGITAAVVTVALAVGVALTW